MKQNSGRQRDHHQNREVRTKNGKVYKPLPLGVIAVRNLLLFLLITGLLAVLLLAGGNDLTKFYSQEHFGKYAEITSEFVEQEGRWMPWTEHIITVQKVSKSYQYPAAVIDFSAYETEECYSGQIRFHQDAVSNRQQLEHILIKNPTHQIHSDSILYIYTEDEEFNRAYGYRSAEEFYALQEEFEASHADIMAILKNDPEHLMYNLVQGSGWRMLIPVLLLILGGLYALYRRGDRRDLWGEQLNPVTALYAAGMIALSVGCLALFLVGESMAAEGGIAELLIKLTVILTGVAALLFLVSMLVPLLLDNDFLYGISVFCWKAVFAAVVAVLAFGIGVVLEEVMEVYTVLHTVIVIGLVVVNLLAFFAFFSMLAARSVIVQTYMDISYKTLLYVEAIGTPLLMFGIAMRIGQLEKEIDILERKINDDGF